MEYTRAFTEEAIPAVDLFKERVNYAADGTVQSVEKISESTQKAVGSLYGYGPASEQHNRYDVRSANPNHG
ncbi:hypothetical protein ACT7DB_19095 [Bacillus cereus]